MLRTFITNEPLCVILSEGRFTPVVELLRVEQREINPIYRCELSKSAKARVPKRDLQTAR